MNLEKLTTKSQEALRDAQSLAEKRNHQALDVEHLLFSLLGQKEGVVLSLLQKLGVPLTQVTERLQKALDRLPQVTGASGQSYITPRLKKVIESAEAEAEALKDEYVSTEHLLLAIVQDSGEAAKSSKSWAQRAIKFSTPWSAFAALSASPIRIQKKNINPWKSMAAISPTSLARASSIR